MTKSNAHGQKKAKCRAFDEEHNLLHIMLCWLHDIGYTTTTQNGGGPAEIKIFWNGQDTEARLEVYKEEVILYTHKTHPSLRAGIYDKEAFGRLKRFMEAYAEMFNGRNALYYTIFPAWFRRYDRD